MRVFNEDKTQELQEYDLTLGHLQSDKLLVNHQDAIEENIVYKEIKHYDKNGKLVGVAKRIDEENSKFAQPEINEYEDIQIYIPYTTTEFNNIACRKLEDWFSNSYKMYCEMLTRRQALQIEDSIYDEFRNKTYTNLMELYLEAEIVASEIKELRLSN